MPPRGGSGNGTQAGTDAAARGEITPLRLSPPASSPTPIPIVVGFGPTGAAAGTMAASALSVAPASSPGSRTPALSTPDAASVVPAPGLPPVIEVVRHRTAPAPGSPAIGGPSPLYNIGLPEIYVLDVNRGVQLLPNYQSPGTHLNQLATLGASVDLLAQVHLLNDTMDFPGYYSWDTSGLTHANSFSGTSTDELTFHWYSTNSTAAIDTVTLHVHTSAGSDFDYPYSFSVPTLWSAPQKLVHLKWESLARLCPGGAHEEATDCRPGGAIAP